ncbi:MAG: 5'/3'-nucleotidase SurE [Steroidobacteraceae bacterium]|nr:5'/3'-nucleotidase SurE [Steroidobacteraceae bacterium]
MLKKTVLRAGCVLATLLVANQALALNILLTNDDGFESAQIRALYASLEARGHSVVISAPAQNHSGSGGAMNFLQPIGPLTRPTRGGTVPAGEPGVGRDRSDPDIHYVNGTPVMSLLYGLDVIASRKWGAAPDLVISGPNEGNNQGMINPASGTFNNALFAINRGIPAIAVSTGEVAQKNGLPTDPGATEFRIASLVVALIERIERNNERAHRRTSFLPPGTGLNVNVPKFDPAHGCTPEKYHFTRVGTATAYQPVFFEKLSESPAAVSFGAASPLPGISFVLAGGKAPAGVRLVEDDDPDSEANANQECFISISPIQGVPEASAANARAVRARLRGIPTK